MKKTSFVGNNDAFQTNQKIHLAQVQIEHTKHLLDTVTVYIRYRTVLLIITPWISYKCSSLNNLVPLLLSKCTNVNFIQNTANHVAKILCTPGYPLISSNKEHIIIYDLKFQQY